MTNRLFHVLLLTILALAAPAHAAEIYSNGSGGGPWTEGGSWRGGKPPAPEDDVVIARDDTITFDRNDTGKVTCLKLSLDPRAVLQFKQNAGAIVFTAGDAIESYGTIKLDASKAATDRHELRLAAEDIEQRSLKIFKGGGLIVSGRNVLAKAKKNATLVGVGLPSKDDKMPPPDPTALIESGEGTTLDVQRAEIANIYLQATGIDNTGAKPGERININRNFFNGTSRLLLTSCDTPVIADNLFERRELPVTQQAAVYFNSCPLVDMRNNAIKGNYAGGITFYGGVDASVTNNLIEDCQSGFYYYGANGMIKGLTVRNSGHGLTMTSASGALEDVVIEKCTSGYYHGGATVQATNLIVRDMIANPNGYDIYYGTGPLTLVNCDIKPEQIKFNQPLPVHIPGKEYPLVTSLQFVVVKVNGSVPPGSSIDAVTTQPPVTLAPGATDPNIRNAPAAVASNGFTPLPKTLEPLIVRSWMHDKDGKLLQAPTYELRLLAPSGSEQEMRKVIKTMPITPVPEWYRPKPNELKPTVELTP